MVVEGGEVVGGGSVVGGEVVGGGSVVGEVVGGGEVAAQTCHQKLTLVCPRALPLPAMALTRKVVAVGEPAWVWEKLVERLLVTGDLGVTWISAGVDPSPCVTVQNPLTLVVQVATPPTSVRGWALEGWNVSNADSSASAANGMSLRRRTMSSPARGLLLAKT